MVSKKDVGNTVVANYFNVGGTLFSIKWPKPTFDLF